MGRVGGIWGKDKLEAAPGSFPSQLSHTLPFLQKFLFRWSKNIREHHLCIATKVLLLGNTYEGFPKVDYFYPLLFSSKSPHNVFFLMNEWAGLVESNTNTIYNIKMLKNLMQSRVGMGGERKEEKRERYERVRKKLSKKGNSQSIPPALLLQST